MPMPKIDDRDRNYLLLGLRIVSEFGAAIAIPAVVAAMLGQRLDAAYGTKPTFLIGIFALAVLFSAIYVVKRANAVAKEFEALIAASSKKEGTKGAGDGKPDTTK